MSKRTPFVPFPTPHPLLSDSWTLQDGGWLKEDEESAVNRGKSKPSTWFRCLSIWRAIYFRIFLPSFGLFFLDPLCGFWLFCVLASWLLGFLASWLLGFSASGFSGFLASGFSGFLAFRFLASNCP